MLSVLELDHAVMPFFVRCQAVGLPVDRPGCLALAEEMRARQADLLESIHDKLGYYINPNSADQVRAVLVDLLPADELEGLTLTDGGEISTGKKVIEALRGLVAPIDDIIESRQCKKIETSFALPLALERDPPPPAEPNRARANLRLTRTVSGRVSMSKNDDTGGVSLLTLPKKTEKGRKVRKQIKIQKPGRVLMARDLSQIEFRVTADQSGDRTMCDLFHRGQDLHKQTAAKIFGKRIEDLDDLAERLPAKNAGFGILYGITAKGLRDQMRVMGVGHLWPEDRCQEMLDEWFKVYPGVQRFISQTRAEAAARGYVSDMCGRRRYLPGAASGLSWVREEAWRQAVSLKIQGSAQAILKTAMAELWPLLGEHWRTPGAGYLEPLLQVHDELLWEIDESLADWWSAVVDAALTTTTQLRVPITSSGGTALDWGSLEK